MAGIRRAANGVKWQLHPCRNRRVSLLAEFAQFEPLAAFLLYETFATHAAI